MKDHILTGKAIWAFLGVLFVAVMVSVLLHRAETTTGNELWAAATEMPLSRLVDEAVK